MTEREKVIKGLECCLLETQEQAELSCAACPYDPCGVSVHLPISLIEDVRKLITAQPERINELEAAQQWISVKDRLPEKGGTYLCYQSFAANPCKVNTYRWSEKNECFMGHEVGSKIDGVTFWMPLPEPPKEG